MAQSSDPKVRLPRAVVDELRQASQALQVPIATLALYAVAEWIERHREEGYQTLHAPASLSEWCVPQDTTASR